MSCKPIKDSEPPNVLKRKTFDDENQDLKIVESKTSSIWSEEEKSYKKSREQVGVRWKDLEVTIIEIPNKDDLEVSEIWHDLKNLGHDALMRRNNPEEIKEYSDSMLSLDCLSPENRERYSLEVLQKEAEELFKPIQVDQSHIVDSNQEDLGLDLDGF